MVNPKSQQDPSKLLSRLRLAQFNLLRGVADGYSFRQLADHMALSQPAISKMAREMESALGESIFQRERNGVRLTPLGERLAHDARLIVNHISRIEEQVVAHRESTGAILRVGSPSYTAVSLLSGPVSQLVRQHPTAQIKMIDGVARTLLNSLKAGDIDFLIGSLPTTEPHNDQSPQFQVEVLYPDEVCFLAHKSKARSDKPVTLSALQNFSWIMPSQDSLIRQSLQNAMLTSGLAYPTASVESSVISTIGALVAENDNCIGALRADAAHYLAQQLNLTVIQTQQRIPLPPVAIIQLQHTEPLPIATELFTLIRKRVSSLFKQTTRVD